jgi:hypothetical protein
MKSIPHGGRLSKALIVMGLASTVACSGVTDTLLEATDPDIINPGDIRSIEGAQALAVGAIDRLTAITAGGESTWLFGGLLVDEWSTSSTFVQNDETDKRSIQENNGSITGMLYRLYRTRTAANQAIRELNEWLPSATETIAEMYFARGFADLQLASDFCNGIPLSDGSGEEIILGVPQSVDEVFASAVAAFDSAIALVPGTSSDQVLINRAARIGKGRAQLGLNQIDAAAATVAGIPTSFAYQSTFSLTTQTNTIWAQGRSAGRYTVGDSVEGNSRDLLVANAIPFASSADPRLPVTITSIPGQDGLTNLRRTDAYVQLTPVDVVNGLDARFIEAEKALRDGDATTWLSILNGLRASPPTIHEIPVDAMPALTDPGSQDARIDLHFREKAFWTFSRGQRLGDMRRLVRQYGRSINDVYPTGQHYKGGDYGTDVVLPIVTDERNNPNFTGCTNNNP